MSTFLFILCVVVAFVILAIVADRHSKYFFIQYGFFTRYSTAHGIILFCLPLLGPWVAPAMLSNLFVMDFWGAMLTGLSAALYAWAIVYTFRLTWLSIPIRCRLPYHRRGTRSGGWLAAAKSIAENLHATRYKLVSPKLAAMALVLVIPLCIRVIIWAEHAWWMNLIGFALGLLLAFIVFILGSWLNDSWQRLPEQPWRPENRQRVDYGKLGLFGKMWAIYLDYYACFDIAPAMSVIHRRAARFFWISLFIVIILGVVYSPLFQFNTALPALVILLSLLMLLTWISGVVGFIFDKDRVPVVLVLILLGIVLQFLIHNDHLYRTDPWPEQQTVTASAALKKRIDHIATATKGEPVVAVAASGGGIRAALWTAVVLEQLADQIDGFEDRISIISSVSGGSIANAYYFDQHYCNQNESGVTEHSAGTSSLAATVWGLTYLETPRLVLSSNPLFGLFGSNFKYYDRGWVQEQTWSRQLNSPDLKISDLAQGVGDGTWPIPVFNSCFQESGQRFLISPVDIHAPQNDPNVAITGAHITESTPNFLDSVGSLQQDMRIVTAARLSASFPYATPQSRSETPSDDDKAVNRTRVIHGADGGFYDNSGVLTVLEIFDRYLTDQATNAENENSGLKPLQLALVEIRASPGDFDASAKPASGGLATEILGPPKTIFNVLFGSQSARNRQEVQWLGQLWSQRPGPEVELKHFVFYLSGGPLSWHLTDAEKQTIRWHWPHCELPESAGELPEKLKLARQHNAATFEALKQFIEN